jgi:hypothetical protein
MISRKKIFDCGVRLQRITVILDFGKVVIKCVNTAFLLKFIFRLFQEFGRYMNLGENVMPIFFSATIIMVIVKFT